MSLTREKILSSLGPLSAGSFASTDITAMFPTNAGPLDLRENNLGGDIGSTEIVTSLLYNFAPDSTRQIMGPIGSQKGIWAMYYLFYLYNKNATVAVSNIKIWIYRAASNPNIAVAIGLDPGGKNAIGRTIPDQTTAPAGVTFVSPFTKTATNILKIDLLAPGDKYPIWVKTMGNKGMDSISQASYGIMWTYERPAGS